jgi:hypothetical protein
MGEPAGHTWLVAVGVAYESQHMFSTVAIINIHPQSRHGDRSAQHRPWHHFGSISSPVRSQKTFMQQCMVQRRNNGLLAETMQR